LALIVTPVFYVLLDSLGNFMYRIGIRFSVEQTPMPGATAHDAATVIPPPTSKVKTDRDADRLEEESVV
jgi:hypothetical protein